MQHPATADNITSFKPFIILLDLAAMSEDTTTP
jgi:hypothetical protein